MSIQFQVITNGVFNSSLLAETAGSRIEKAVAIQAHKDTMPYVPFLNGMLRKQSRVIGNTIYYPGPYARYLWYGKRMVDAETGRGPFYIEDVGYRFRRGARLIPTETPLKYSTPGTGAFWFERSKQKNLKKWIRIAQKAVKNGL